MTREPALPASDQVSQLAGYSAARIKAMEDGVRYFAMANFLRIVITLPILTMFWVHNAFFWFWLWVLFCTYHATIVLAEFYKATLVGLLRPDPDPNAKAEEEIGQPWGDRWFRPRKFESEKFYRFLGIEFFRFLTTAYIEKTKLTLERRSTGERVKYVEKPSPQDLLRFELGTRTAEMIHGIMAVFGLIPAIFALTNGLWFPYIPYTLWILWGDSWLVLLQRYHRVRVWKTIERLRTRLSRQGITA
jgi:hypothetical protein